MNADERKVFWEKLCSFDGYDVKAEGQELTQVIKLPQFLYRYRAVKESTMDAFKNNKLYFSNSSYYDDPFDTYLNINYRKIYQQLIQTQGYKDHSISVFEQICKDNGEDEKRVAQAVKKFCELSNEQVFNVLSSFLKNEIQPLIRNTSMAVCFSESGINESMWLKYADQYKGFCVMYSCVRKMKQTFCVGNRINARSVVLQSMVRLYIRCFILMRNMMQQNMLII